MIAFYSKINRNGKIDFKFIEVIIDKIKQTSIKI
jgi:hypothetical protein